jgi:hypothetical protein
MPLMKTTAAQASQLVRKGTDPDVDMEPAVTAATAPREAPAAAAGSAARATVAPPWRPNGHKKRQTQDEEGERHQLLLQTAKLALQATRALRLQAAALQHTAIIAADPAVAKAISEQGQRYYKEHVKGRKEKDDLTSDLQGSPHLLLWKVMITTIAGSNLEVADREVLVAHAGRFEEAEYLAARVFVCRLAKAHEEGRMKLTLSCSEDLRQVLGTLIRVLRAMGAEWKLGAAPRGPTERAVEHLLSRVGA